MMTIKFKSISYWISWFVFYLAAIVACGGIIGSVLYAIVGMLSHPDLHWTLRLQYGFSDGSKYAGVWAVGLSLVLCVMKGYKKACAKSTAAELG